MLKKSLILSTLLLALFSCETEDSSIAPNSNASNLNTPNGNTTTGSNSPGSTSSTSSSFKNFTLTSDANLKVSLSDYKNNVVVLFFFGNGCSSCKAVSPDIQKTFVDGYAKKPVQVIGLDAWDGNLASVKSFKSASNLTFPLLLEGSSVAKSYETTYDRILVLDKEGVVRFKGNQLARNDVANAKKTIDQLLGN